MKIWYVFFFASKEVPTYIKHMRIFLILWLTLCTLYAAPQVAVSIKPIHSLVANVMVGVAEPKLLMHEAGQSPHITALKPSDVVAAEKADLLIWIGPCYEEGLISLVARIPHQVLTLIDTHGLAVYQTREGPEWGDVHQGPDGHIWLDPRNAKVIVEAVKEKLIALDPAHADQYRANAAATQERLDQLIRALNPRLAVIRGKHYIAAHDAYQNWDHFAGTQCIGAVQAEPDIPASPKHLQRLAMHKSVVLFSEPQLSDDYVNKLAALIDVYPVKIDPLGDNIPAGVDAYFDILIRLADTMINTFQG